MGEKVKLAEPGEEGDSVQFVQQDPKNQSACARIDEVNWLSFISFAWIFNYLWSAYRGKVDPNRTWTCSIFDSANINVTRLEHLWNDELKRKPDNPSFFIVVLRFMQLRLIVACIIFVFCLVFGFIGPTCLVRGLIAFTENIPRVESGGIDYLFGFYLIASIVMVEVSRVLLYGATWAVSYRTGIRVRGAVLSLMYKTLLNAKSMRGKTPAEIVNICANDGQRIFDAVTFAPLVLIGPFVLVGGLVYLLKVIGPWSLLGVGVFFVFDILQAVLGVTMVKCRNLAIERTEKRMNLMGEIIRCIRIIKMNSWEDLFASRVIDVREEEKRYLRIAGYAQSLAIASGTIVPVVATIVTVLAVVLSGSDLLASDAFSAITVFFVMLFGIRMIPYGIRYLAEARTAIVKIQQLLLIPRFGNEIPLPTQPNVAVAMKNSTFAWDISVEPTVAPKKTKKDEQLLSETTTRTAQCLKKLNLIVEKKELIGVCGSVGSGKTALLSAILGHLNEEEGDLSVSGNVAFVSQIPFILNATIRENILFGQSMNTQRYYKVISAVQLNKDLETMPANELSEVGERGTTLSGGQKTRVALARALYANRDIYLLDDIFSATDANIADAIFDSAIKDMLSTKTVILVTTNSQYLSQCDRVIYLDQGILVDCGKHSELLDRCQMYQNFLVHSTESESSRNTTAQNEDIPVNVAATTVSNDESKGKIVEEEEDYGFKTISKEIYTEYINAFGGFKILAIVVCAFVINVSCGIFSTFWLSKWMKDGHKETLTANGTIHRGSLADNEDVSYYSTVYALSLVALFGTGLFKAMIFVKISLTASTHLHNRMLKRVLRAVTSFFDSTPTGRILNRFSKDMDEIDVKLPFSSEALLQTAITSIGFLMMIIWVFPWFLVACFPLSALFLAFFLCFRSGIRSLKRTENVSRSPLFEHVSSSLEGISTIHSYGQTGRFLDGFKSKLDENSGSLFMFQSAMRWQAVWLDLLVVAVTSMVSVFIVLLTGTVSPADAGMALSFALQMSGIFQFAVRSQTELEAKLTAVERVSYYYKNIEIEAQPESAALSISASADWPTCGEIVFENVVLRYLKEAAPALRDISFQIANAEKIGVVGRTGSGKTSLSNALFRLYPLETGRILLDTQDIALADLRRLRRSMAIIPQDPVLFCETLRFNLDPEKKSTDDQMWMFLEKVGLKQTVMDLPGKLDFNVEDGGKNLSAGQRQLLCVVRALLRNVKVVVLDEATANMDAQTDFVTQLAIRQTFEQQTVILITHRITNVADMDRTLQMDEGRAHFESSHKHVKADEEDRKNTDVNGTVTDDSPPLSEPVNTVHQDTSQDEE